MLTACLGRGNWEHVARWLPMAFENSPVLFPARPLEGMLSTEASRPTPLVEGREGAEHRETWPLVHALAATLNGPSPLPDLAEVLGTHFGARACLLLCHYPATDDLIYICWHRGAPSTSHRLGTEADTRSDGQRRVALGLIRQTLDQHTVNQFSGQVWRCWRRSLTELLQADNGPPSWLRSISIATAIAVAIEIDRSQLGGPLSACSSSVRLRRQQRQTCPENWLTVCWSRVCRIRPRATRRCPSDRVSASVPSRWLVEGAPRCQQI